MEWIAGEGDLRIGAREDGRSLFTSRSPRSGIRALLLMLGLSLGTGCQREDGFTIPTARYVSPVYGFSVAYPDTMDVREYTPERITIGFAAGDGFDPRVEIAVESDTAASFEALLDRKARDSCLADGPGSSLRCTTIERLGTVRAESREVGEVIHLTLEVTDSTGAVVDSMPRGPYIGFNLGRRDGAHAVLFVRAPATRQLWETDVELVSNVARSLEMED